MLLLHLFVKEKNALNLSFKYIEKGISYYLPRIEVVNLEEDNLKLKGTFVFLVFLFIQIYLKVA